MSREIKFRAWDKANNRFVNHNQWLNNTEVSASVLVQSILTINHQGWVIMQYTGLKDKNGVEIYEGDIVKLGLCSDNYEVYIGEVCYIEQECLWKIGKEYIFNISHYAHKEVIGNIYENETLSKDTQ